MIRFAPLAALALAVIPLAGCVVEPDGYYGGGYGYSPAPYYQAPAYGYGYSYGGRGPGYAPGYASGYRPGPAPRFFGRGNDAPHDRGPAHRAAPSPPRMAGPPLQVQPGRMPGASGRLPPRVEQGAD